MLETTLALTQTHLSFFYYSCYFSTFRVKQHPQLSPSCMGPYVEHQNLIIISGIWHAKKNNQKNSGHIHTKYPDARKTANYKPAIHTVRGMPMLYFKNITFYVSIEADAVTNKERGETNKEKHPKSTEPLLRRAANGRPNKWSEGSLANCSFCHSPHTY